MEALACGTPVVAFRTGTLPDVVEHGATGFLVEDAQQMAAALAAAEDLDSNACRRAARERFSLERMTMRYLEVYTRLTHSSGGVEEWRSARAPRSVTYDP